MKSPVQETIAMDPKEDSQEIMELEEQLAGMKQTMEVMEKLGLDLTQVQEGITAQEESIKGARESHQKYGPGKLKKIKDLRKELQEIEMCIASMKEFSWDGVENMEEKMDSLKEQIQQLEMKPAADRVKSIQDKLSHKEKVMEKRQEEIDKMEKIIQELKDKQEEDAEEEEGDEDEDSSDTTDQKTEQGDG